MAPISKLTTISAHFKKCQLPTIVPGLNVLQKEQITISLNGIAALVGLDPDNIAELCAPNSDSDVLSLNRMLGVIGYGTEEIEVWCTPAGNHAYPSLIAEDALSLIIFYLAHIVSHDKRSDQAKNLCQIVVAYGIRSVLKLLIFKIKGGRFQINDSPEPPSLPLLAFMSLLAICKHQRTVEQIKNYVTDCTGSLDSSTIQYVDVDDTFLDCNNVTPFRLHTTDAWLDNEDRAYVTLNAAADLIHVSDVSLKQLIRTHALGSMLLRKQAKKLAESGVSNEEAKIWMDLGAMPADAIPIIENVFETCQYSPKQLTASTLIGRYGCKNFVLACIPKVELGNRFVIASLDKHVQDRYADIYTIRSKQTSSSIQPLSAITLWLDEQNVYRMSLRGVADILNSRSVTIKNMFTNTDDHNCILFRNDLYALGYSDRDIEGIIQPRMGIPEDVIELIVKHYRMKRKGVKKGRAAAIQKSIDAMGIRGMLEMYVQKSVNRSGECVPITRKRKEKELILKHGDQ